MSLLALATATTLALFANADSTDQSAREFLNSPGVSISMQGAANALTVAQVQDLEKELKANPDDIRKRVTLITYYMNQSMFQQAASPFKDHVLYVIKHYPETRYAGNPTLRLDGLVMPGETNPVSELWKQHVKEQPDNIAILHNAARHFAVRDPKENEKLLLAARKLEPEDSKISFDLARTYMRQEQCGQSLAAFEEGFKTCSVSDRYNQLSDAAKAAFCAGEIEKAESYAKELLDLAVETGSGWNYGNAVHHGNLVLGRIALKKDKIEEAETYLLRAGRTPGSPQLNSFGPNMQLASELLERGRKESVLQYFDLCKKFWAMPRGKLDLWKQQVEKGETPNFGGNMKY